MRCLLLAVVVLYWSVARVFRYRRTCLFRLSCSRHVFATAKSAGLLAGLAALRSRFRACRPGYRIEQGASGEFAMRLADGSMLPLHEASDAVERESWPEVHGLRPAGDHEIEPRRTDVTR